MRDRAAEGRALRPCRIDMDPLEVLDRLGEGIDALLGDLDPWRHADFLPDAGFEAANGGHFCWPGGVVPNCVARPCLSRSKSEADSALRRAAPAGARRAGPARTHPDAPGILAVAPPPPVEGPRLCPRPWVRDSPERPLRPFPPAP